MARPPRLGDKPAQTGARLTEQDAAFADVYAELRAIARRERRRNPQNTLNTTAIVHEAWLKLRDRGGVWNGREHYIGTAAMAMRQVLIDYARYRAARKRDAGKEERLFENAGAQGGTATELLAIDQALEGLETLDPRLANLVSLRFFAGLSLDEIARQLDISPRTAARDWNKARAYLQTVLRA
jgi:RNA polymerase sigma factor (TIGR02999 family)